MQRLQAYLFELMPPAGSDERLMRRFCGSRRFVFNKGLALQKERHAAGLKHLSYSQNGKKAKVRSIQARIARIRRDFLHQTSTQISKSHAVVCVEDLKVRNMTASAAGNAEQPGTNVRAKAGLNKAILDQGWGRFVRQLADKLEWRGGLLVAVDPRTTSRRCPECRHVDADNRPSQARFACVACGHEAHADHVGAINVLRAGHARLACGETSPLMASAQEPTEAGSRSRRDTRQESPPFTEGRMSICADLENRCSSEFVLDCWWPKSDTWQPSQRPA